MSFREWKEVAIKELCIKISSGGTPSRGNKSYFANGIYNWIKTQELRDCNIYDADEKITKEALKNSSAKLYPIDTVSMAMYGATVGKLGVLKVESATNQACCNMVVDTKKYCIFSLGLPVKKFGADIVKNDDEASVKYGYAKYMRDSLPNASYIGFTGTPVELTDKNTRAVFGEYIDV